jgi:CheY-like chemotaxis protein/anti-sigma regulatory factor (Ser/Thr protein kinase)
MSDILEKFRHQYNQECLNKGLSFKINYTEETGNIYHELDPELLSKAINHLLSNAVKFTSKGSIEFGIEKASDQIIIYITDTGIGISKDNISTVFEHFRQEDDSSSRRFEGSGLGLAIVKGLVDLLSGTISVESEKGMGSTFRIHFSLKSRNNSEGHASEETKTPINKEPVVLIAEDEDSNFVVLSMVMRKSFNAKVIHALNGLEAVKMVQSNPDIDVVLMDLKMPVMDGFEATAQIKKLQPDLPVIAITAFAMSGDKHRAMEIGCDFYIAKPVSRRELDKAMRKFGFLGNDPY